MKSLTRKISRVMHKNVADNQSTPKHLGLILDGNRRWAESKGLPKLEGHRQGYENLKDIARTAFELGIKFVSVYAFSTENWNRTKEEISYLMNMATKIATNDAKGLIKENIKIVVLGVADKVPKKVLATWRKVEEDSKNNTGGTLVLCFNYGGLREITDAIRSIVRQGIVEDEVSEATLMQNLYHPEIPAIDFMIRTSGEMRISNFMLPRMAYAELYFSEKTWPEFTKTDLKKALNEYTRRQRRYGT